MWNELALSSVFNGYATASVNLERAVVEKKEIILIAFFGRRLIYL